MMSEWLYTERELWRHGEGGYSLFHVFGLLSTRKGCVMAFAEARYGDGGDAGVPHDIVMRCSMDDGEHFEPSVVLVPCEGVRCMVNPTPLYDAETGRAWLFFAENKNNTHTELFSIHSDDLGQTWSSPVSMDAVRALNGEDVYPFCLPGPGHAIQIARGAHKGRLIVQLWHRRNCGMDVPARERGYCVSFIYSDDHGASWTHSGYLGAEVMANESRIVETRDSLLWILRPAEMTARFQMRSFDGGETWTKPVPTPINPGNNCDDGAISLQAKGDYQDTVLLSRVSCIKRREDMEILVSRDGGYTFSEVMKLPVGDAMPGYSDLNLLAEEDAVGLVHCRNNHVLFSRISLQTITGGRYEKTRRKVWLW